MNVQSGTPDELSPHATGVRLADVTAVLWPSAPGGRAQSTTAQLFLQLAIVFVVYFIAGKLGQATTNIRSSNLGPVWPAYGIALGAVLAYGRPIWPAIAASAFAVAVQGAVSPLAAAGQAAGATLAALLGAWALRQELDFDPALTRLRDAVRFVLLGAFGSALVSASVGILALYATGVQPYNGIPTAWLIYWLGDSTGVLLVTPLIFTMADLCGPKHRAQFVEMTTLLALVAATCVVVFGDLPLIPIRLHVLAFAVLPLVMWAAIDFGIGGAALSVFQIATIATVLTAFGHGPFAGSTPFINAALLDVLFVVLAVSGLFLAAVITERERAENAQERMAREQAAMEVRLRHAAIVESSEDAILSTSLDGVILSWNAAAERIFGRREADAVNQPITSIGAAALAHDEHAILDRLHAGECILHFEGVQTIGSDTVQVSWTISPLRDAAGSLIGTARIARDISEQKRAQEALSTVSRKLIDAQEQERARIARELHDDIGQRLALLTTRLSGLARGARDHDAVHREARELQKQASDIAAAVQALSHELHSSKIDILGIATAMRLFCQEFADQQHVHVAFAADDLASQPPSNTSLCLFRVLQEALHNAAKHSGSRRFDVQLTQVDGEVHLVVTDRGKGFDVATSKTGSGIGLVSMEERIKLVNGVLAIDSRRQSGTTVHARVPIASA